jgi:gamma-glutamyltranspeptidase/glutathione hydrolase
MLNMLEQYPLDTLGWNSSDYIHLLTEIERRAYADRAEHMGDPDFWEVPVSMLVSKEYAFERIQNISMEKATKSSVVKAGDPLAYESRETTHYSVIDKNGNAVSVTTTLNTGFGCGVLVEGAGFFLNNEMDDFSAKPGSPNIFGLIGNEANAIQPYKRPLSSMTPTIVLKNGEPFLIIGTPGGSTIITTVMQIILNVAIHGMDIQEAVSVPRVHSQWLPDAIIVEQRSLSKDVEQNLINRGHIIRPYRWGTIGQANGIMIGEKGFYGGADPRGENATEGY